jgi:hypothetical protein
MLDIIGDVAGDRHDAEKNTFFIQEAGFGDTQRSYPVPRVNFNEGVDRLFGCNRLAVMFSEVAGGLFAKQVAVRLSGNGPDRAISQPG